MLVVPSQVISTLTKLPEAKGVEKVVELPVLKSVYFTESTEDAL